MAKKTNNQSKPRLTKAVKDKIVVSYQKSGIAVQVASEFKITRQTVTKIVGEYKANGEFDKLSERVNKEITNDILHDMVTASNINNELLGIFQNLLVKKAKELEHNPFDGVKDIATAYGIVVDKEHQIQNFNLTHKKIDLTNKKLEVEIEYSKIRALVLELEIKSLDGKTTDGEMLDGLKNIMDQLKVAPLELGDIDA